MVHELQILAHIGISIYPFIGFIRFRHIRNCEAFFTDLFSCLHLKRIELNFADGKYGLNPV